MQTVELTLGLCSRFMRIVWNNLASAAVVVGPLDEEDISDGASIL